VQILQRAQPSHIRFAVSRSDCEKFQLCVGIFALTQKAHPRPSVNNMQQTYSHPQIAARQMVSDIPVRLV
jgi:hypothetical protein